MLKLVLAAAAGAFVLDLAAAGAAPLPGTLAGPVPAAAAIPAAAKRNNVIPANCTMDPFKKVYRCCTTDSGGNVSCTEHPLDTKWPLQRQLHQVRPLQSQPLAVEPVQ